jgi:hypothetical protein
MYASRLVVDGLKKLKPLFQYWTGLGLVDSECARPLSRPYLVRPTCSAAAGAKPYFAPFASARCRVILGRRCAPLQSPIPTSLRFCGRVELPRRGAAAARAPIPSERNTPPPRHSATRPRAAPTRSAPSSHPGLSPRGSCSLAAPLRSAPSPPDRAPRDRPGSRVPI